MRARLAVLVGVVVLQSATLGLTAAAQPEGSHRPGMGQTLSADGLRLTLSVVDTVVRPMEPIELVTTLEYIGSGERITFDAPSEGPVKHQLRSLDEELIGRQVSWNLDCTPYELKRGQIEEQPLDVWASYEPGAPDEAFQRAVMADPGLHLPRGRWAIDAVLRYYPDAGCGGPETWAQATVIVDVHGAAWPVASPASFPVASPDP